MITSGLLNSATSATIDDSSCSDDCADSHSINFLLGGAPTTPLVSSDCRRSLTQSETSDVNQVSQIPAASPKPPVDILSQAISIANDCAVLETTSFESYDSGRCENSHSTSSSEHPVTVPLRIKKKAKAAALSVPQTPVPNPNIVGREPLPPPRKTGHR
ncbi:hypothetical protein KR009_001324 [Drosophila setifemur]|nr:hypothetical protein KR009_001324 [Drosophila setifemur]